MYFSIHLDYRNAAMTYWITNSMFPGNFNAKRLFYQVGN